MITPPFFPFFFFTFLGGIQQKDAIILAICSSYPARVSVIYIVHLTLRKYLNWFHAFFTLFNLNIFLTFSATCTSVLASTLYLRNEACSDQVKSKDKHCTEKRRIIDESLVTCNDRNVVLNQERETVMNDLEEQRELLSSGYNHL